MIEISVIIPMYNSEKTIQKCLDSLINQQMIKEIIIIDDGSTDKSKEIVLKYINDKINLISTSNKGVSTARNLGLKNVKTSHFMFVDSDDYVSGNIQIESEDKDIYLFPIDSINLNVKNYSCIEEAIMELGIKRVYGKIFKTNIVKENEIMFDTEMSFGEDYKFVCNYLYIVNSYEIVSNCVYNQQTSNPNSLSKKYIENLDYVLDSLFSSIKVIFTKGKYEEYYYRYEYNFDLKRFFTKVDNAFKNKMLSRTERRKEVYNLIKDYRKILQTCKLTKKEQPKRKIDKILLICVKLRLNYILYKCYYIKYKKRGLI